MRGSVSALLLFLAAGCAARTQQACPTPYTAQEGPAAQVGSRLITQEELDQAAQGGLKMIENEAYQTRKAELDKLIDDELLRLEAERTGQSAASFKTSLSESGRRELLERLRRQYPVKVHLAPPRFDISIEGRPIRGNPNAPVTIVEYSDFECPYCKRFQPVLQKLRARYPENVRFVFKHLPLPFHRQARMAHLASICAGEQGKFWEYRDRLFDAGQGLAQGALTGYARELGLSMDPFDQCLGGSRYRELIDQDLAEAKKLGVNGTPTFFVNGRMLSGARPFEDFAEIIEEELSKSN